jgi:hypothetical protein
MVAPFALGLLLLHPRQKKTDRFCKRSKFFPSVALAKEIMLINKMILIIFDYQLKAAFSGRLRLLVGAICHINQFLGAGLPSGRRGQAF